MKTNNGDHPHWDDLPVSHDDKSAWKEEVPGDDDWGNDNDDEET